MKVDEVDSCDLSACDIFAIALSSRARDLHHFRQDETEALMATGHCWPE
jgi:hypothetical protein